MEKEEIVNLLLERGMSIDPKGLDYFYQKPEQIDSFFEKIEKMEEKPTTISFELIKDLLETLPAEIEVVKPSVPSKKIILVDDISRMLVERYEKIQKYFSTRIDLVNPISINKITQKTKRFSLVVMVKEKDEKNKMLVVEDLTGETSVHVSNNTAFDLIVSDEVFGLLCEKNDDTIEVVNTLWPDIPLKREIPKTEKDTYCVFLSDLHLEQDFEEKTKKILKEIEVLNAHYIYIFLFGENTHDKEMLKKFVKNLPPNNKAVVIQNNSEIFEIENVLWFSSPVVLNIEKRIRLLLCDGKQFSFYKNLWSTKKSEEIMLNLLKKRHLDPVFKFEKALLEDRYVIDGVPDIFVSGNFNSPGMLNYKGTTIISCGSFPAEPVYWVVNLRTRESIKMCLL
jgi:DNA polymerase II small subunit/DNA polymerase delta subunit B